MHEKVTQFVVIKDKLHCTRDKKNFRSIKRANFLVPSAG